MLVSLKWTKIRSKRGKHKKKSYIYILLGISKLAKAEWMRERHEAISKRYAEAFQHNDALNLYQIWENRISSWHLYPLKINLNALKIGRDDEVDCFIKTDLKIVQENRR